MPELMKMLGGNIPTKQWITYYKNAWQRNVAARMADVQMDIMLKAKDPNKEVVSTDEVIHETGQVMTINVMVPVKVRLEQRKLDLEDGLAMVAALSALDAMSDEDFAKFTSPEALAVADGMKPIPAETAQNASAEVAPTLSEYKVGDKDVTLADGTVAPTGSSLKLDPAGADATTLLASSSISLVTDAQVK